MVLYVSRIDLGNYQGDIWLHPEGGTIIDNSGAGTRSQGRELSADIGTGREKRNVNAFKGIWRRFLDLYLLIVHFEPSPHRAV
jgi:hypothetical protein